MTRVLIVDDQAEIRTGIAAMLSVDPSLVVDGDVSDGFQALDHLRRNRVDLVLMDIRMPGIDGVETTRRLRAEHPSAQVRVIVLTTFDQDDVVLAAIRAGANGFLGKTASPAELVAGIAEVVRGGGALSAAATAALISRVAGTPPDLVDPDPTPVFDSLTPREREVVVRIASGLGNEEIAVLLDVSPFTVKTHAVRAMSKVGARDRAQLVTLAFRAGLYP